MAFLNFYHHTKNQFIPLILFWDTAYFTVLRLEWSYPFFTMPIPIFFNQLLISMNLYQQNQAFSSLCSWDIADLKILQSDSPRAFWPISREPDFSLAWDFSKNIAQLNIKFLYRSNSQKNQWLNLPINSK